MPWRTIEVLGYAYFVSRGYRILYPLVENHAYDFVAEKAGVFTRVNVKKAFLMKGEKQWAISRSSSSYRGGVDVFLAFIPTEGRFIELDGDFLNTQKVRRIPMRLTRKLEEDHG